MRLTKDASGVPKIELDQSYSYEELSRDFDPVPCDFSMRWKDSLAWNPAGFSFYDKDLETKKLRNARNFILRNIVQARLALLESPLDCTDISIERVDELGYFGVLWPD